MTSTIGSTYTPDVQRYIVQSSDVLSEHRLTVSPLADPSAVIWYTERYISHPESGPAEIVENIVHQPTNTICWSVHRPTNIRRQGWYIRLRSPMFPPGVSIPMQPVSSTSPYYVDGALSFKCRTNVQAESSDGGGRRNQRPAPMLRTSTSSVTSVASSSSSVQHSYPPTPAATSPPQPLIPLSSRPELPPLQTSSRAGKGRSLTGEGEDGVYILGLDDTTAEVDTAKTPTSAATIMPQQQPRSPPPANSEFIEPLSNKAKDPLADSLSPPQPKPNGLPRRLPPPQRPSAPVTITEFILVPLSETASASCGPYANLSPYVASASTSTNPTSPLYPHSHHRTYSSSFSRGGAQSATPNGASQRNSTGGGVFGKALNLLKSSLPTSVTSSVAATWQGNSFTIVRIPDGASPRPSTLNGIGSATVPSPPPCTSTANLLGTPSSSTTTLVNDGGSAAYPFHSSSSILQGAPPNAISSASFVQPLPPPLLSFADETSLFGPLPSFGLGKLLGYQTPAVSSMRGSGRGHAPSASLPATSPSTSLPSSSSSATAPPFPLNPHPAGSPSHQPQRGAPTPNYTTLGTLTVSTSQLASLGVDTAFWISCALVFWGYLEEREGYLSAIDD